MSDIPRYTENELRVHISQAVAAAVERERERCAKIVESQRFWEVVPELAGGIDSADVMSDLLNFQIYGPVADAIRKG